MKFHDVTSDHIVALLALIGANNDKFNVCVGYRESVAENYLQNWSYSVVKAE